jgi:hypothetical protein
MGLGNLLGRLRAPRFFASGRNAANSEPPYRRKRAVFEPLESRVLLSAILYVDFGDAFAGGVLNTTVGALDSTVSGSNPNIDGPVLSDSAGNDYAAGTAVTIQSFNSVYGATGAAEAVTDRQTMMAMVQRFYAPLDITVQQASAASLADISVTLGANEAQAENNDSYVIVGLFMINGTDNPVYFASNGYGGLATGTDINNFNNNDGTAFVLMRPFSDRYSEQFLGVQVAHESGHLFGLRHTFGNNPASSPNVDEGLHQSDMMSYLAYTTFGGLDFFTRYPMVRGDGNTDNDVLGAFSASTPYDQMRVDPNIGPSSMEYVTGTGQNDIITITKTGATTGTVTVQAFTDAAYTSAIEVPGSAVSGSVFTYTIDLTKPLTIDAGARDDRIVLDADLGTTITLRGMHGNDDVVIMGKGAASGLYVPGTNTANGLDGNSDLRGSIVIGSTTINFQEFEPGASGSTVTVQDIGTFTLRTPLATDLLTLDSVTAGQSRVSGTSGGITIVPMTFFNVASLLVDTATNDGGGGSDTFTVASGGLVAAGLQNLTFDAGTGGDLLVLNVANYLLPAGGGAITFLGGSGTDEVRATADASFTLSDTSLGISTGGAVVLSSVNRATLTGGAGANSFSVSNWSGEATLRGQGGDDAYTVDFVGAGTGTVHVDDSSGTGDTLAVNGTVGIDALTIAAASVSRGGETVTHSGIDDLSVDARGGADLITVNGTGPVTTVLGGAGEDDFFVNAVAIAGITLNGQGDSDDYTVNFGLLDGIVNVADAPVGVFDRLFVNGTSSDDVLLIAPAFVKRGSAETVNYSGIEELNVDAGDGDDDITVDGTSVPTNVFGGIGDDDFTVNGPMGAALHLDGGPGTDSLLFNGTPGNDVIILTDSSITGLGAGVTFVSIENLVIDAGAGNDLVDGSALTISVTIYGGTGDDTLIGGSNNDKLYGEEDNDDLIGNLGNDYLDGGSGSDGLVGDQGTIVRVVLDGSTATTLAIPSGKLSATIDEAGIRRDVTLTDADQGGDDELVGGEGDDYAHGGAGNDKLAGDEGNDALFGDAGNDTVAGGTGDDHMYGGAGNDTLDGQEGADLAYGGDGDDRLIADQSGDRLIDWFGNFNDFVVPGPGYGSPTIVRSPSQWVQDFVLNLARDDGATDPNAEIRVVIPGSSLQQSNSGPGGRT